MSMGDLSADRFPPFGAERAAEEGRKKNIPVTPAVWEQLLTRQHQRKLAGQPWSFDDIIRDLLAGQPVQP